MWTWWNSGTITLSPAAPSSPPRPSRPSSSRRWLRSLKPSGRPRRRPGCSSTRAERSSTSFRPWSRRASTFSPLSTPRGGGWPRKSSRMPPVASGRDAASGWSCTGVWVPASSPRTSGPYAARSSTWCGFLARTGAISWLRRETFSRTWRPRSSRPSSAWRPPRPLLAPPGARAAVQARGGGNPMLAAKTFWKSGRLERSTTVTRRARARAAARAARDKRAISAPAPAALPTGVTGTPG